LYGADDHDGVGGFRAFFLLLDRPETYGLPPDPRSTTRDLKRIWKAAGVAAGVFVGVAMPLSGGDDDGQRRTADDAQGQPDVVPRPAGHQGAGVAVAIPAYLFTGGLAAGSALLGFGSRGCADQTMARRPRSPPSARSG
jgi:hypothetical protein